MSRNQQDAGSCEANEIFKRFLRDTALSELDRNKREAALLSLSMDLKEAAEGPLQNVVLFPFGTAYHGIGFKDDPLTVFVTTGKRLVQAKKTRKKLVNDDIEMEPGEYSITDDDYDGEKSSSTSEDDDNASTGSLSNGNRRGGRDRCCMPQALLLDIKDTLTNQVNGLSRTYAKVTFTREGKIYFVHRQHAPLIEEESGTDTTIAHLHCHLEAKSFLVVQTSRLIKFYCTLEQILWPFSQLLLNWAKINGLTHHSCEGAESDGFKQEHLLFLIIFFLVRRRIIPSCHLLQSWCTSHDQLTVDDLKIGFCEDIELVKQNCQQFGIGSVGPDEWTLERILQLQYEFFNEMASFHYASQGISTGGGTSFSKLDQSQRLAMKPTNKKRMDTNSLLCIQDIWDHSKNVTRKVSENWVAKFKSRCKVAADHLFKLLWNGDLLNATLSVMEVGNMDEIVHPWFLDFELEDSSDVDISCGWPVKRLISYSVPSRFLEMLSQSYHLVENVAELGCDLTIYPLAVKTLFESFVEEFNDLFWRKLLAAHIIQNNGDPMNFGFVYPVGCAPDIPTKRKAECVVKTLMDLFYFHQRGQRETEATNAITRFYVKDDWTKEIREDALTEDFTSTCDAFKLVRLLEGARDSKVIYGRRVAQPQKPQIMAAIELHARVENNNFEFHTFARLNNAVQESMEEIRLMQYLERYEVFFNIFMRNKFGQWMGAHVMRDLDLDKEEYTPPPTGKKRKISNVDSPLPSRAPPHLQPQLSSWILNSQFAGNPTQRCSSLPAGGSQFQVKVSQSQRGCIRPPMSPRGTFSGRGLGRGSSRGGFFGFPPSSRGRRGRGMMGRRSRGPRKMF